MSPKGKLAATSFALAAVALASLPAGAASPKTRLVSVSSGEDVSNEESNAYINSLSDDGTRAVFHNGSHLSGQDDNLFRDVYVRNLKSGKTRLASVRSNGNDGNDVSEQGAISGNGRFVAFVSAADNLVPSDENDERDTFVHNLATGKTARVSVTSSEEERAGEGDQPDISRTGRFVAFATSSQLVSKDNNHVDDVYVRDRKLGKTIMASVDSNGENNPDGDSNYPSISNNGRVVAFESASDSLVPNDGNSSVDVFMHNLRTGNTRRLSVKSNGNEMAGTSNQVSLSEDGRFAAFASQAELAGVDDNGFYDIYLRNTVADKTILISKDSMGQDANEESQYPTMAAGGRMVGFYSEATDIVPGLDPVDYRAYVFDRKTGKFRMVDRESNGDPGDQPSFSTGLSEDGRFVLFVSGSELVGADDNGVDDVYRRGPLY
jgi:hypothetical protein